MRTMKIKCDWNGCKESVYVPHADDGGFGATPKELRSWGDITYVKPENRDGDQHEKWGNLCPKHDKKLRRLLKRKLLLRFGGTRP